MKKLADITKIALGSIRRPIFWMINFGVIAVCFLSGPFGTLEALPSGFRLIYWGLIVLTTSMLAMWLHMLIRHQRRITIPLITVVSTGFGVLVACIVLLLSLLLLYPIDRYPSHFELISYSFPSAALIFFLSALVRRSMSVPNNSLEVEMPALFDRLEKIPHAKQVLSLTAQDHYVEVSTDLGSELCLMRLSDAIEQVKPIAGFQIHRSHWVAKSAIKKVDANATAPKVHLSDGRKLSISKSRLTEFSDFLKKN